MNTFNKLYTGFLMSLGLLFSASSLMAMNDDKLVNKESSSVFSSLYGKVNQKVSQGIQKIRKMKGVSYTKKLVISQLETRFFNGENIIFSKMVKKRPFAMGGLGILATGLVFAFGYIIYQVAVYSIYLVCLPFATEEETTEEETTEEAIIA